jgi:serralysin
VLEGTAGTGPILQYGGSPVTVGEFGGWTPIGAVQQSGGYLVAWKMAGQDQYVVWDTNGSGNYLGGATGVVSGEDFSLEDLEPTFGQNLNGEDTVSTVLDTTTSTGGVLNLTGQIQATTINLGENTASAGTGLNAPSLSFLGTPDAITLGSGATKIEYTLAQSSGIETIANFVYGQDELNIDLPGAAPGLLQAYDTAVGGAHAIAIASSTDLTHGLVLLNMTGGQTAANLLASHTTFVGGHALIS